VTVPADWKNRLYFADNLDVLRDTKEFPDDFVDLVYLDPPFKSNATYNVLFKEKSGKKSGAQIGAFEDTWSWGPEAENDYHDMVTKGPLSASQLLKSMRELLGQSDMMGYLCMMAPRLVERRRTLKPIADVCECARMSLERP
jgi:site-specific DNA-methyltransferase (adenine-specific)